MHANVWLRADADHCCAYIIGRVGFFCGPAHLTANNEINFPTKYFTVSNAFLWLHQNNRNKSTRYMESAATCSVAALRSPRSCRLSHSAARASIARWKRTPLDACSRMGSAWCALGSTKSSLRERCGDSDSIYDMRYACYAIHLAAYFELLD